MNTLASFSYITTPFYDLTLGCVEERLVSGRTDYLVNAAAVAQGMQTITYNMNSGLSNPAQVSVPKYDSANSSETVYTLSYTSSGTHWSDGLAQTVQHKTLPSPQQVLRTEDTTWTQDNVSLAFIDNPRPTSKKVTLDNGQYTHTDFTYTSDGTGNVRQTTEYGFAAEVIRRTTTNYLHETNPAYAALNLVNLPSSISITDAAGTEVSRTEYAYDVSVLTSYASVLNHDSAYGSTLATRGNATSVRRLLKQAPPPEWLRAHCDDSSSKRPFIQPGNPERDGQPEWLGNKLCFSMGVNDSLRQCDRRPDDCGRYQQRACDYGSAWTR